MIISFILGIRSALLWISASIYLNKNYPDKFPFPWWYPGLMILMVDKSKVNELRQKYPDWHSPMWMGGWKKLPQELENDIDFNILWSKCKKGLLYTVIFSLVTIIIMLTYPLLLVIKRL